MPPLRLRMYRQTSQKLRELLISFVSSTHPLSRQHHPVYLCTAENEPTLLRVTRKATSWDRMPLLRLVQTVPIIMIFDIKSDCIAFIKGIDREYWGATKVPSIRHGTCPSLVYIYMNLYKLILKYMIHIDHY